MENLFENPFRKTPEDDEEKQRRPIIKSATDLQRLKLEKLMKNPDKPIIIPEQPREKDYMQTVPSFVRNVMGSSAGAGSGEFHVYRHLRRKEYARQKCIQAKSIREQLDEEYQMKLEKNRLEAEAKTAKKRAKRMKKKQRAKKPRTKKEDQKDDEKEENTSEEEEDDEKSNDVVDPVQPPLQESSEKEDEQSKNGDVKRGEGKVEKASPKDQEDVKAADDVSAMELGGDGEEVKVAAQENQKGATDAAKETIEAEATKGEEVQVAPSEHQKEAAEKAKKTTEDESAKGEVEVAAPENQEEVADEAKKTAEDESTKDEEVQVAAPENQEEATFEAKNTQEDKSTKGEEVQEAPTNVEAAKKDELQVPEAKASVTDSSDEKSSANCDKSDDARSGDSKSNVEELSK